MELVDRRLKPPTKRGEGMLGKEGHQRAQQRQGFKRKLSLHKFLKTEVTTCKEVIN